MKIYEIKIMFVAIGFDEIYASDVYHITKDEFYLFYKVANAFFYKISCATKLITKNRRI